MFKWIFLYFNMCPDRCKILLRVRMYSELMFVQLTVDKIASWLNFSLCTSAWIIHASNNKKNNVNIFFFFLNFSHRTDLWSDLVSFFLYRVLTSASKLEIKGQEVEEHF